MDKNKIREFIDIVYPKPWKLQEIRNTLYIVSSENNIIMGFYNNVSHRSYQINKTIASSIVNENKKYTGSLKFNVEYFLGTIIKSSISDLKHKDHDIYISRQSILFEKYDLRKSEILEIEKCLGEEICEKLNSNNIGC